MREKVKVKAKAEVKAEVEANAKANANAKVKLSPCGNAGLPCRAKHGKVGGKRHVKNGAVKKQQFVTAPEKPVDAQVFQCNLHRLFFCFVAFSGKKRWLSAEKTNVEGM